MAGTGVATPAAASWYGNRGLIHLETKNYDDAIADFSSSVELSPANEVSYRCRGLAYSKKKQWAKENAVKEISMAKLFAGDLAQKVAYDCQQFFGGMGYIEETPIARAWRDIRLITIGGGTSEVMKEIISKMSF